MVDLPSSAHRWPSTAGRTSISPRTIAAVIVVMFRPVSVAVRRAGLARYVQSLAPGTLARQGRTRQFHSPPASIDESCHQTGAFEQQRWRSHAPGDMSSPSGHCWIIHIRWRAPEHGILCVNDHVGHEDES